MTSVRTTTLPDGPGMTVRWLLTLPWLMLAFGVPTVAIVFVLLAQRGVPGRPTMPLWVFGWSVLAFLVLLLLRRVPEWWSGIGYILGLFAGLGLTEVGWNGYLSVVVGGILGFVPMGLASAAGKRLTRPLGLDLAVSRRQVAIQGGAGHGTLLVDPDGAEYRAAGASSGTLPERAFRWSQVRKIYRWTVPSEEPNSDDLNAVRFTLSYGGRPLVVPVAETVDVDLVVAYCAALASRPGPPLWQVRFKAAAEWTNTGGERLCKIYPYRTLMTTLMLVYFTVQRWDVADEWIWLSVGWLAVGAWVVAQGVQLRSAMRKLGERRPFGQCR